MLQKTSRPYLAELASHLERFIVHDKAKVLLLPINSSEHALPDHFIRDHIQLSLNERSYIITEINLGETASNLVGPLFGIEDKNHIIIFYNYEALGHFENLWVSHNLYRLKNVKIVITCDQKYLSRISDFSPYFSPFSQEKHIKDGLMSPFTMPYIPEDRSGSLAEKSLALQNTKTDNLASHPLNKRHYSREEVSAQLWADSIRRNNPITAQLIEIYIKIIHLSKFNPAISMLASNAFNILIMGNVNLSGYDFSDIVAPNANLIGGYFDSTLFRRARLPGLNLSLCWARNADFTNAVLNGCNFGTLPYLKSENTTHAVLFRTDLDFIYTTDGNKIIVWKLSTLTQFKIYNGHTKKVLCLCLDSEGRILISGGEDGCIHIWNIFNDESFKLEGHNGAVNTLSLKSLDSYLASGGADGSVRIWDLKEKQEKARSPVRTTFGVRSVSCAKNADWVASTSNEAILLWNPLQNAQQKLIGFKKNTACVDINDDGNMIIAGSIDGSLALWDLRLSNTPLYFTPHKEYVCRVKFSKDFKNFASASYDKSIRFWSLQNKTFTVIQGHENRIHDVDLSEDCLQIASCSHDQTIRIWNVSSFQNGQLSGHQDMVKAIIFSPDGRFFCSASSDTLVKMWNTKSGQELLSFSGGKAKVIAVHINKKGTHVCSGSDDGTIVVRDIQSNEERIITEYKTHINSIYLNHSATKIYVGLWDNTIRVFDLRTNESQIIGKHEDKVNAIDLSDDESLLVSGSVDKSVCIWELNEPSLREKLLGHSFIVIAVKITADGKYALSAGIDRNIKVWDIEKKIEIASFSGHSSIIWCIDLSKDGRFAASGSADKTIRIWDIQQKKLSYIIDTAKTPMGLSMQDDKLVVGYDEGTIHLWKKANETTGTWILHWSSKLYNPILHLARCKFFNTQGLTATDQRLISQKDGALTDSAELSL